MPLEFRGEDDNVVNCKCNGCGKIFLINKTQLKYISPTKYDIFQPGIKCECGSYYSNIEKRIASKKVTTTTWTNNGCAMLIGSVVLFFLIFLMAKGCGVNKSIIPDSYFKSGGGGIEQYQKDVKEGEYIYKLNQELKKR